MKHSHLRAPAIALAFAACLAACDSESSEQRARAAAEKIQSSIPNQLAVALKQKASPENVKEAQEALTLAKEYMGEVDGDLDVVTVNAIQAFQRRNGLQDDGILDDETTRLLRQVKTAEPLQGR
jgi:peptidoglycan hydrolase-like protein with peptidoglycan-binding domain